jgi:hypothetical protein
VIRYLLWQADEAIEQRCAGLLNGPRSDELNILILRRARFGARKQFQNEVSASKLFELASASSGDCRPATPWAGRPAW